jgi:hypothetical protein
MLTLTDALLSIRFSPPGKPPLVPRNFVSRSQEYGLSGGAPEKVPAAQNKNGKHGHAVKRQHGFFAGNARIRCCRP